MTNDWIDMPGIQPTKNADGTYTYSMPRCQYEPPGPPTGFVTQCVLPAGHTVPHRLSVTLIPGAFGSPRKDAKP